MVVLVDCCFYFHCVSLKIFSRVPSHHGPIFTLVCPWYTNSEHNGGKTNVEFLGGGKIFSRFPSHQGPIFTLVFPWYTNTEHNGWKTNV